MKVLFVVINGVEVKLIQGIYDYLVDKKVDVINISMGKICCEPDIEYPDDALKRFGMKYKTYSEYKGIMDIFEKELPDVVVLGSDQEYVRRTFIYIADALNIHVLLVFLGISDNLENVPKIALKMNIYRLSHHFVNIFNKYMMLLKVVLQLRWNVFKILKMIFRDIKLALTMSDARGMFGKHKVVVATSWDKKVFGDRGVNLNDIIITGDPSINVPKHTNGVSIRNDLSIGVNEKVILLLTCSQIEHGHWTMDMRTRFINGVVNSCNGYKLIIKIHPVENLNQYKEMVNGRAILFKDINLVDVISASDIVLVGGYSTTVIDSYLLRKPTIILNVFNEIEPIPYVEMGLATCVYQLNELPHVIESIFKDSMGVKPSSFIEVNKELVDGCANQRIGDLIIGMARNKNVN